jgi:hypothetical protein
MNFFFPRLTTAVVNIVTAVVNIVTAVNIYNRERDWSIVNVIILAEGWTYRSIERNRLIERCRPMKRRSLFKLPGYRSIASVTGQS